MAAPAVTARQAPTGRMLEDGFSSVYAFSRDPNVNLWEKTVTPVGIDGGDAIDVTTMHNDNWRTFAPRTLRTLTEGSFTAAYDPICYNEILQMINIEQAITQHLPDGSSVAFYGYLRVFEPNELSEGEHPEATVTIQPTNRDPTTGAEEAPVVTLVAGT